MNNEKVDTELAYLAGLFEGEGSAGITKFATKDAWCGYRHCSRIRITMTDFEPVNAFKRRWGGNIIKTTRTDVNVQTQYLWQAKDSLCRQVAEEMMPYILSPRKQGALQCMIDYDNTVQRYRSKLHYRLSPDILQYRETLYEKCKWYNARGTEANNKTDAQIARISNYEFPNLQMELF